MRCVSYTRTTSCYPGADIPSDVITSQNERIKNYAVKHGWKIENRYSDRKKSKEENTAFEQLLNDGIQRKFDAVIVDSIFRAGKDLWSAREVLLQTLHYAGIGFVVVEDDYISIGKSNAEAEAYFDKQYGILRSENIRHRVLHRNRSGVLSWNDAKYGYRLTDDYELVVDEETAPVVRRIFQMCADGMPIPKVAAVLSEEKIPSPLAMRGTNVKIDNPYKWTRLSVRRLLDKTVYIGHWSKVVQGEVIEFTNEPIISEEIFREAQKVINTPTYTSKKPKPKHRYAGIVCDSEHGFCLRYREGIAGGYFGYVNREKNASDKMQLPVECVDAAVVSALQKAKRQAIHILQMVKTDGEALKNQKIQSFREEYRRRAYIMAEKEERRMETYQSFLKGKISKEEMDKVLAAVRKSVEEQEAYFGAHEDFFKRTEMMFSENNPWLKLYSSWESDCELNKDVIKKYVSSIVIHQLTTVSVELREMEWYKGLPDEWRMNNGEEK